MNSTKQKTTLAEYMAMPEEKPYRELLDGWVVEKCMGYWRQQTLVTQIIATLYTYTKQNRLPMPLPYLSCSDATQEWVVIPALSYSSNARMPWTGKSAPHPIPVLPEFVVEALGEGEDAGWFLRRIEHYMNNGVRLLWAIDPESELVTAWQPGFPPTVHRSPATISAAPVLPDFELDLTQFFNSLRD